MGGPGPGRCLGCLLGGVLGPSKANIFRNIQKNVKNVFLFPGVTLPRKRNVKKRGPVAQCLFLPPARRSKKIEFGTFWSAIRDYGLKLGPNESEWSSNHF